MSLQFLQREVDFLYDKFINTNSKWGNKNLRPLLNKQPHVGEFNAPDLAKQLEKVTTKIDGVKTETFAGKLPLLNKYTNDVLKAYQNSPLIPQNEGDVRENKAYRILLMKSDTEKVIIKVTGPQPFNYYRDDLNAAIQTKVISGNDDYKELFGIKQGEDDTAIAARVKKTQQLGHADGQGVVNKKVDVFAGGIFGGDGDELTPQVILEDMPEMSSGGSYKGAFEDLLGITLDVEHLQKFKMKQGKFTDELEIAVKVEGKEANQAKANLDVDGGGPERDLGADLAGLVRQLQKDLKKELGDVKKGTRKERSPSPIQVVGHMVFAGSNLQKILKNKKLSGRSSSPYKKVPPRQQAPKKVSHSKDFKGKKPTYSKGLLTPTIARKLGAKKRQKPRTEVGTTVQDAFVAKAFINTRLSKQVANNMGRPQLDNITGRFANSVQITNATSTGQQAHFDYTYNPLYRVFENGSDYSPNYDPRPLIEKSIRQLAAARMETKFTLRRV